MPSRYCRQNLALKDAGVKTLSNLYLSSDHFWLLCLSTNELKRMNKEETHAFKTLAFAKGNNTVFVEQRDKHALSLGSIFGTKR